ncbi:MAG: hypothetical protein ACXVA9_04475 [Bdellovibrionales bacterium]
MKKIGALIVLLAGVVSVAVFAKATKVYSCSNDGTTKVTLVEVAKDSYVADVTVQAAGGGLPTFKFAKIERLPSTGRAGAPAIYRGRGFDLEIRFLGRIDGKLTVPSLGVRNEQLTCKN